MTVNSALMRVKNAQIIANQMVAIWLHPKPVCKSALIAYKHAKIALLNAKSISRNARMKHALKHARIVSENAKSASEHVKTVSNNAKMADSNVLLRVKNA